MDESILNSIKKLLGIDPDCTDFDLDIMFHINSALMVLGQLGVGPEEGFKIADSAAEWGDFIGDSKILEGVKSYIHMKVKLLFDPPLSSAVMEAMNRMISEFEWRLSIAADPGEISDKEEIQNG